MAIFPLQNEEERFIEINEEETIEPSKTYRLDFEKGRIGGFIDEEQAIRQFIRKALMTARFRFLIYDDQYGSELEYLIGSDVTDEFLQSEIPRVITDALIYDDRIEDVRDFEIERKKGDLYVTFLVETVDGLLLDESVVI